MKITYNMRDNYDLNEAKSIIGTASGKYYNFSANATLWVRDKKDVFEAFGLKIDLYCTVKDMNGKLYGNAMSNGNMDYKEMLKTSLETAYEKYKESKGK